MKLVVFSDIHGNSFALDAFLTKLKSIEYDYLIFCGDIFGYYYNQSQIIEKLSEQRNLIWLKGNHDEYFVKLFYGKLEAAGYIENYGHSYEKLTERFTQKEVQLIESLASEYVLSIDNYKIGIFHGTPENPLEGRLYPDMHSVRESFYLPYDIVILGHTHCRMNRTIGTTAVLNPGSLGQPRDGSGFGFAVINTKSRTIDFQNVSFDQRLLYAQIDFYDSGLSKLKDVLERRRDSEANISNSY